MAFKNEQISDHDREWVTALVTYENIRAISCRVGGVHGIHNFEPLVLSWWTADHGRDAYFLSLGGGGTPDDVARMPYAVLLLEGHIVLFNLVRKGTGDRVVGKHLIYEVHNLTADSSLRFRDDEVRQVLREALEEYAYHRPFADGGTMANPNMVARLNVKSVEIEFK